MTILQRKGSPCQCQPCEVNNQGKIAIYLTRIDKLLNRQLTTVSNGIAAQSQILDTTNPAGQRQAVQDAVLAGKLTKASAHYPVACGSCNCLVP